MNEILEKITKMMKERDWKLGHLSKVSGVPHSTLVNLYKRNNVPTIPTLESICRAFGITMSAFFAGDDGLTKLTEEQQQLLDKWDTLSEKNKKAVWALLKEL